MSNDDDDDDVEKIVSNILHLPPDKFHIAAITWNKDHDTWYNKSLVWDYIERTEIEQLKNHFLELDWVDKLNSIANPTIYIIKSKIDSTRIFLFDVLFTVHINEHTPDLITSDDLWYTKILNDDWVCTCLTEGKFNQHSKVNILAYSNLDKMKQTAILLKLC